MDPGVNTRHEIALLADWDCVGVEVGVDTGQLSERFLKLDHFSSFHSVDKWDDHAHSEKQYWAVAEKLMKYQRSHLWRMTAEKFASLCPDEMFGFVYIDCYAHTGQDGGAVLRAFWPKLKPGGIFSGDDYERRLWPKTFDAVNIFAASVGRDVSIYAEHVSTARIGQDKHPSWWFRK